MTIEEIDRLPFVAEGRPEQIFGKVWDFRGKTAEDLAPVCFGAFYQVGDRSNVRIVYGGVARANEAVLELAKLGIESKIVHEPPAWNWNVEFILADSEAEQRENSTSACAPVEDWRP